MPEDVDELFARLRAPTKGTKPGGVVGVWLPGRELTALQEMSDRTGLSKSFIMRVVFSIFEGTATAREKKMLKRMIVNT